MFSVAEGRFRGSKSVHFRTHVFNACWLHGEVQRRDEAVLRNRMSKNNLRALRRPPTLFRGLEVCAMAEFNGETRNSAGNTTREYEAAGGMSRNGIYSVADRL